MGFTKTQAQLILNAVGGAPSSATSVGATNVYMGLSTTTPAYDGSRFTEPSGDGYARARLYLAEDILDMFSDAAYDADADEFYIANKEVVMFDECHNDENTGDWGQLTYFGLFSSTSAATPYFVGALKNGGIAVSEGQVALFRVGELKITMEGITAEASVE